MVHKSTKLACTQPIKSNEEKILIVIAKTNRGHDWIAGFSFMDRDSVQDSSGINVHLAVSADSVQQPTFSKTLLTPLSVEDFIEIALDF